MLSGLEYGTSWLCLEATKFLDMTVYSNKQTKRVQKLAFFPLFSPKYILRLWLRLTGSAGYDISIFEQKSQCRLKRYQK